MPQCAMAQCGSSLRDLQEFLFRLFVPEGVQQRDAAVERLLHRRGAGDGEMHRAQLRRGEIFVVMMILVVVGETGKAKKAMKSRRQANRFIESPLRARGNSSHASPEGQTSSLYYSAHCSPLAQGRISGVAAPLLTNSARADRAQNDENLIGSQCVHGLDARSPRLAGMNPAIGRETRQDHEDCSGQRQRIVGAHTVELGRPSGVHPAARPACRSPGQARPANSAAQHQSDHVAAIRAERHAQADFAGAPRNRIRSDAIEAHRRQHERQQSEQCRQAGDQALLVEIFGDLDSPAT